MEVVKQEGIKDCGVCCLLSVMRHYGGNCSLEYLRELTSTTKNGVTAYNLVNASIKIGFNSYGIKAKLEDLKKEMLPIISHVIISQKYQHFIVIYSINFTKKELIVMDPAIGKRKLSFSEFNLMTSNNFIYLKPIKKILRLEKRKIINEWLTRFINKNKKYIPYIIILTIIYTFLNITSAFYFKLLLNNAVYLNILDNVFVVTNFMIVITLLKELSNYLKNLTLLKWDEMLDEYLTMNVLKRLIFLPYLYYNNRTVGEIISRMKDLTSIKTFLANLFSSISTDVILIIIFMYFLFSISNKLGGILILLSILFLIEEIIFNKFYIKRMDTYLKNEDKINSILYENLSSMDTIKSMHLEKKKNTSFQKEYQTFLAKAYKVNKIILNNNFISNLVGNAFQIILLSFGSFLIIENKLSIGNLIVFQTILNYYVNALKGVLSIYKDYHKYRLARTRIEELFTIKVENFNCLEFFNDYKLNGTINIKNLTYSCGYKKIFDKLNLKIKRKDKVFLTGPSGIGKSTLMKLLCRFINVEYGSISINNMDITHIHLDVLRRKITYISQQESLFTGTIKENILIEGEEDKLDKICKITKVDEILDKDLKYSKMIEEGGVNLSGGERQRIILARALTRESDIYIFDEALSQLDVEKEEIILTNILKYLKDKTVIVISHRTAQKALFNRVLELREGKIYEELQEV